MLAGVETVLARPRPYVAAEVGPALGVVLTETAASNAFFRVWASAGGLGPFASVEVREPQARSVERGRNGMILLTLEAGCVTAADLAPLVGPSDGVPSTPSPEAPADTPRYVVHPAPWGVVCLGYAPEAETGSCVSESSAGAAWYSVSVCTSSITSCSASQRSASMAAMQPVPAAVRACQ